jgi:hypothetical protein
VRQRTDESDRNIDAARSPFHGDAMALVAWQRRNIRCAREQLIDFRGNSLAAE